MKTIGIFLRSALYVPKHTKLDNMKIIFDSLIFSSMKSYSGLDWCLTNKFEWVWFESSSNQVPNCLVRVLYGCTYNWLPNLPQAFEENLDRPCNSNFSLDPYDESKRQLLSTVALSTLVNPDPSLSMMLISTMWQLENSLIFS